MQGQAGGRELGHLWVRGCTCIPQYRFVTQVALSAGRPQGLKQDPLGVIGQYKH